jgi:hypothetical protein
VADTTVGSERRQQERRLPTALLRYRYGALWASILAHGFLDTIGFATFFVVGPIYGLW